MSLARFFQRLSISPKKPKKYSQEFHTQLTLNWRAHKNWAGGIKVNSKKELTSKSAISTLRAGHSKLYVPIGPASKQHHIHVQLGDLVFKGQKLAGANDDEVWVHAPTSGMITHISSGYICGNSLEQTIIEIQADGKHYCPPSECYEHQLKAQDLAAFLMRMGVVGLGGAGFPTGKKIAATADPKYLLINGIECEPYITADDRLMQERSEELIKSIQTLARILAVRYVRVGIEDNKPRALEKMRNAVRWAQANIDIVEVPTFYPAGSQQALIKSLTNIDIPHGQHPSQFGVVLLNVATAYAAGRAIHFNEPLTSRVVTLTGDVLQPRNLEVPIGTPIHQLIRKCKPRPKKYTLWAGGPMMGKAVTNLDSVLGKTNNCLIVHSEEHTLKSTAAECIRCSRCVDACPAQLQPMQLYKASVDRNLFLLTDLKLSACIECGACSSVCPSQIPLRDTFRNAKQK